MTANSSLAGPIESHSKFSPCRLALSKVISSFSNTRTVLKNDPLRILFTTPIEKEEQSEINPPNPKALPLLGFWAFTKYKLKNTIEFFATPFRWTETYLLDRPVEWVTSKSSIVAKRRLNAAVKIMISAIALSIPYNTTVEYIDTETASNMIELFEENASTHQDVLFTLIEKDYRYHDIKLKLRRQEIDTVEAIEQALALETLLVSYLLQTGELDTSSNPNSLVLGFVDNPLFSFLTEYLISEGIDIDPTNKMVSDLFIERHLHLMALNQLDQILANERTTNESGEKIDLKKAFVFLGGDISFSSFSNRLVDLYDSGKISLDELKYLLQRDFEDTHQVRLTQVINPDLTVETELQNSQRNSILSRLEAR